MDEDLTKPEDAQTLVEPQESERSSFRDEFLGQQPKESSGTKVAIGVLVLLIVGGIIGGTIFLRGRSETTGTVPPTATISPTPFPTSIPTPTPSPSPSPSPEAKTGLANYKIQVLNGSGIVGAASKVVKLLETEGAAGIEAGNAESYNYESTEVSLKVGTPTTVFTTVKNALTGYTVVKGKDLAATSKYDVVVTVGAK